MTSNRPLRQALWILAAATFAIALFVGAGTDSGPRSNQERAAALAGEFACPECAGQSVIHSNAPAAVNIRQAIAAMVDEGRTDGEIRALIADRFGERVLLIPPGSGMGALVWIVPVVVGVVALAGLGVVFWRWRAPLARAATDEDHDLVARFLNERDDAVAER